MFNPQDSLATRSRRAHDALATPCDGLEDPRTPRRLREDSFTTRLRRLRRKRVVSDHSTLASYEYLFPA